jgi:predicted secreted protein
MHKRRYLIIAGIVVVIVLISILLHTTLANHRPVITSLIAEPEGVPPLGSCQIVCNATASHGDKLSYNWSASGGIITGEGATVTWTAPNSEPYSEVSYNVTVTVADSHAVAVTNYLTIPVRYNRRPTITSLIANAAWITPSGNLQVTCNATDPDGDNLSYEWTSTGGHISGTGQAVNWTAPKEAGSYNVTVVVKDGYGGENVRKIPLCVDRGTPPTIEKLVVTAKGHIYLRRGTAAGADYDVWVDKEYDIECGASNTSGELFYDWSCTAGNISGEGSTITWSAPDQMSVTATVGVIVSDGAGNCMAKNIVFHVPSCTCGSWGLH